ncbi:MAG TPA: adenylyltransferase/cytidyltransferase family protein [Candidatus Paceibacterota bacterium]|nr:adenylyltransferase/cytidyltransferase family protein [Candidatus Paceibacterota bacterium]
MNKKNIKKKTVVAVSGGFDPLHIGHIRMFKAAKKLGDRLVVILNNDNWLRNKKKFAFMPEQERKEIIESFSFVDQVVITNHRENDPDHSVVRMLKKIKPDIFANGGDRNPTDAKDKKSPLNKDQAHCIEFGIRMVFNVGRGGKIQSSSWLVDKAVKQNTKKRN